MDVASERSKKRLSRKSPHKERHHSTKKVAHNAVECRRKQRISQSIEVLSNVIDSCHCGKETRAEVLQKAVNKIQELQSNNKELQTTINKKSNGYTEEMLQQQLALLLVDHIYLTLSLISHHQHNQAVAMETRKADLPPPTVTSGNERLGFGVESLLDSTTTPPYERAHFRLDSFRDEVDYTHQQNNAMWGEAPHHPHTNYTHYQSELPWLPQYHQQRSYSAVSPPNESGSYLSNVERSSIQSVWRPYHDSTGTVRYSSPSHHSHQVNHQSGFSGHVTGSSFLVGQLLEHVIQ